MSTGIPPTFTKPVTETLTKDISTDSGEFAAIIGGILCAVLLLSVCILAVILRRLSRLKGSYVTNEMDDDNDEESLGSLELSEPLKTKQEE